MKTEILMHFLEKMAPPEYAESWDNVGLLVGSRQREIHKIYIALDADGTAVDAAVSGGCQMILTHHPMLFSAVKTIREDDFTGRRLLKIIENHMNYYAMHTNFDVAVMADLTAERLKLRTLRPLMVTRTDDENLKGIGSVGLLEKPMTLKELAEYVKKTFDLPQVRYYGDPSGIIERAAMCPGSGKGMDSDAIAAGAQVLITGDIDHHYGLDSVEKGLWMIDAGHHGLEHVFVDYMKETLKKAFPELEIMTDRNISPFYIV